MAPAVRRLARSAEPRYLAFGGSASADGLHFAMTWGLPASYPPKDVG